MRRFRWMTLATGMLLAVAACGKGDSVTGPGGGNAPATPTGTYTLASVDAKTLPWTMYADTGYTLQVQSATLSVTADGKWVSKYVTRETVAGFVSTYADSSFGTWSANGSSKSAVFTNAETTQTSNATWTATGLTVQQLDGATTHAYAYTRN